MKLSTIIVLILAGVLTVLALVWVGRVVGFSNSACQQYPYTSGCR